MGAVPVVGGSEGGLFGTITVFVMERQVPFCAKVVMDMFIDGKRLLLHAMYEYGTSPKRPLMPVSILNSRAMPPREPFPESLLSLLLWSLKAQNSKLIRARVVKLPARSRHTQSKPIVPKSVAFHNNDAGTVFAY